MWLDKNKKAVVLVAAVAILAVAVFCLFKLFFPDGRPQIMLGREDGISVMSLPGTASAPVYDLAEEKYASSMAVNKVARMGESFDASSGGQPEERMVVRTAYLSLLVNDVRASVASVAEKAQKAGGFVINSNIYKNGLAPVGSISVRVPSKVLDAVKEEIRTMGEIVEENSSGNDITDEYVDLDSRLRNLQAAESQFLEIMKKAYKIEDILAVQRELTNVRGEIESMEGRMKYLRQSAEMATLTVSVSTVPEALPTFDESEKWRPWATIKDAARSVLNVAKKLSYAVIWFVVFIPVWIFSLLVLWGAYKLLKKYFKNTNQQ